jgi:hypothetical protein
LLLVVLISLPVLLPATAHARDGQRWPGRTITYYDATRDKGAVRRAVLAWNRSGARIAFRRTFNRRAANIVIRNTRRVPAGCGTGQATLGYVGRGRQGYVNILHGYAKDGQGCAWPGQTFVVAHELGHVLGLDHDDRACALLNSSHTNGVAATECVPGLSANEHAAQWRCRLIEPRDARRLVRKYGGRLRPVRKNPWCNIVAPPQAPSPTTAAIDPEAQLIDVTMHRPADRATPPYLRTSMGEASVEAYVGNECLTERPKIGGPLNPDVYLTGTWRVPADTAEIRQTISPGPGSWCYSAWTLDGFGRASTSPATATIEIPPMATQLRSRRAMKPALAAPTADAVQPAPQRFSLAGDAS